MQSVTPSPVNISFEFVQLLFGGAKDGYLIIWIKQDNIIYVCHPAQFPMIAEKVLAQAAKKDIYFGVGLQREKPGKGSRGNAEGVMAFPGFWVDIDIGGIGHSAKNNPPTLEAALEIIDTFPLKPTVIVHTGGGLHVYWLFPELWVLNNRSERKARKLPLKFQRHFIQAARDRGWNIDNTADLARVLRVPGTFNHKLPEPRPVYIYRQEDGNRYPPEDIEALLPDVDETQVSTGKGKAPNLELIVDQCSWMKHCRDDAASLSEPEWYAAFSIIARCENGVALAHEWSKPHPGYTPAETDKKIQHALGPKSGPRTCKNIRENGGEPYCQNCPQWPKTKSPISLGRPAAGPDFPAIEPVNGRLCRVKFDSRGNKKLTPITSYDMEPEEAYSVKGEGEHLKVSLIAGDHKVEVMLPPDTWLGPTNFLKKLPSKEFTFTGNGVDVQQIRNYLAGFDIPTKIGVKTAGFHDGYFVTSEGALSGSGPTIDVVYVGDKCDCGLLNVEITPFDYSIIGNFNTPKVVLPVLGFTAACLFKPRIVEIWGAFPGLNIEGESGGGKTSIIEYVLMKTLAIETPPYSIGDQTKFTFMKLVDSSNSIPIVFDENKRGKQSERQNALISTLVRSSYNCLEGQRGRADQSIQTYRFQAPIVIAGETEFTEPALIDRLICVQMSKEDSWPYKKGFEAIKEAPMATVGRLILEKALTMGKEEIEIILEEERRAVSPSLRDRPRNNAAICRFGIRVLNQVLGIDLDASIIDQVIIENILEEGEERKSNVDNILEAMYLISTYEIKDGEEGGSLKKYLYLDKLEDGIHYQNDGPYLRLWVAGAYPVFLKWARIHGFDSDIIPEHTFKKQLQKESYFVDRKVAVIGSTARKCFIIDLEKMAKKGVEIGDEWRISC